MGRIYPLSAQSVEESTLSLVGAALLGDEAERGFDVVADGFERPGCGGGKDGTGSAGVDTVFDEPKQFTGVFQAFFADTWCSDHAQFTKCERSRTIVDVRDRAQRRLSMRVHTVRELGGLVRDRRERLELTQQEVADRAAVTREWLVRFESGKATVPVSRVLDVLTALDLVVEVSESDA